MALTTASTYAQVTPEEAKADPRLTAGLLRPYPGPLQTKFTKAPRGYKPFYISHIARHGSRWHTDGGTYTRPVEILLQAKADSVITPLGEDVLRRMQLLAENAKDHQGELTPLGFEQHRGVAERMFRHYKRVFKGKNKHILAESTASTRVMLSMYSFCQRLREGNPKLDIYMDASYRIHRHVKGLSAKARKYKKTSPRKAPYKVFEAAMFKPERLMSTLFTDPEYVQRAGINAPKLMEDLYEAASIAYDMPTDVRLNDIFTDEELYEMWQDGNAHYYINNGPDPVGGDSLRCQAVPILMDIIEKADQAIAGNGTVANLRFSHDSYLAPLTTTLQLEGFRGEAQSFEDMRLAWANCKASPMCVNIQLIFFRNRKGNVIVKFMHNEKELGIPIETDHYPYYDWDEVKAFYTSEYGLDNPENLR